MLNDKKINNTLILTIFFNIIIFDFSYFKKYLGAGLQVKKKVNKHTGSALNGNG